MQQILFVVITWLLREVVLKFIVITSIYVALVVLVPMCAGLVIPYTSAGGLTSLFAAVPDSVYFFFYFFRFDVGLPLVISACIARFLIRRLPVIG